MQTKKLRIKEEIKKEQEKLEEEKRIFEQNRNNDPQIKLLTEENEKLKQKIKDIEKDKEIEILKLIQEKDQEIINVLSKKIRLEEDKSVQRCGCIIL